MKKLLLTIIGTMLFCCSFVSKAATAAVTDKGYAASFALSADLQDGMILEKKGIFTLEKKESKLLLTIMDQDGKNAALLTAGLPAANRLTAIIQLERMLELAQGIDGYRATMFFNGRRAAEIDIPSLKINKSSVPLTAAKSVQTVYEQSRMMNSKELRDASRILIRHRWRPKKNACLLETGNLIVDLKTTPGKGTPLVGIYNKNTKSVMIPADGISWELRYKTSDGILAYTSPENFTYKKPEITRKNGTYNIRINWQNDKFDVISNWLISGGRIEADLTVRAKNDSELDAISFPCIRSLKMPGKSKIVIPEFSGIEYPDPFDSLNYRAPWPNGNATMQFWAVYNDRNDGVYLAREDASGAVKEQICQGGGNVLESSWTVAIPRGMQEVKLPGKGVVEVYKGDWFEAGQMYKKFVRTAPWWIEEIPRKDTPEWFLKNPLWLLGFDINSGGTKNTLLYLKDFFGVNYGLETGMLYNMSRKWRFGPDFQYRPEFLVYIDQLREGGVRVGPYYNPRLCFAGKTADQENNYSNTGFHYAVRNAAGDPILENYGDRYAVMCPGCPQWQQQLYENVARIAAGKVDLLYHDQLPCGTPFSCYSDKHGHDAHDPYAWTVKGHWQTYARIKDELRKKHPDLAHTGEDASEAFLHCIDGFMVWRFGMPGHVPLFQSIYAPRIQFVGRGSDTSIISGTYESFFPKYGEQLVFNEQIGWPSLDDIRYPSPRRNYLKKLAQLRNAAVDFFITAEMLKPLKFRKKPETMSCLWGVQSIHNVVTDKILHGVWRNKDGRIMIVFLNTVDEKQTVEPIIGFEFKNMTALRELGKTITRYGKKIPGKVELAPFGAEFWFFDTSASDPDVAKVAKQLPVTAKIMTSDRGPLLPYMPSNMKKLSYQNAVSKPIYAKDADWLLFAARYKSAGLDFKEGSSLPHLKGNWISAQDGAVISYGATFIDQNSKGIELEVTTDQPGVKVQFIDISDPGKDVLMAEAAVPVGHWYHRKKIQFNWKQKPHTHTPWMILKVVGGQCNIGYWQVVMPAGKSPAAAPATAPAMPDYRLEDQFYMQGAVRNPLTPAQSRWMLFAKMDGKHIAARDGAMICYGGAFIGDPPDYAELEIGNADPGVKIEFLDIWKESVYIPLAAVSTEPGSKMKKYRVDWRKDITTGRPFMLIRVTGGKCTIGSFKAYQK